MGVFDRLFGRGSKRSGSDLSPEIEAIFEKIHNLMIDETIQNKSYPPELQQMMAAGGAVDQNEGSAGEFGRDIRTPIPVNGFIGELVYISNLVLPGGCAIMGHRLGSINKIDVYETVSLDGSRWDILFFDLYHTRKSKRLPSGYQASSTPQGFFLATNVMVSTFPGGMYEAMSEHTERTLGTPLVSPALKEERLFQGFSRPGSHLRSLEDLRFHGRTEWRSS